MNEAISGSGSETSDIASLHSGYLFLL